MWLFHGIESCEVAEMEKRIRVGVAEDIEYLLKDICKALSKDERLEVVARATSGREIVRLMQETEADIILMDIEMENDSAGIWAAEQIAAESPGVVILFLTVHEEEDFIYQAFSSAPQVDYIVKSASHEEIIQKIIDCYYGRNRIEPQIVRTITKEFSRMKRKEQEMNYFINLSFAITTSERELIRMLLEGKSVSSIAKERVVEVSTIKSQINTLLKKFHMKRTKEIIAMIREISVEHIFYRD